MLARSKLNSGYEEWKKRVMKNIKPLLKKKKITED